MRIIIMKINILILRCFCQLKALSANLYEFAIIKRVCGCEDEAVPKLELSQTYKFFLNSPLSLELIL